jgi:biotin transport system substrate-specific component
MLAGTAVVYAGGLAQLTLILGSFSDAVAAGMIPFLVGDALKLALGLLIAYRLRDRALGLL